METNFCKICGQENIYELYNGDDDYILIKKFMGKHEELFQLRIRDGDYKSIGVDLTLSELKDVSNEIIKVINEKNEADD